MIPDITCHRCGTALRTGCAEFYVVKIEAFADPTGPDLDAMDEVEDREERWRELTHAVEGLSEQEAMDQVYRRMTLHLCNACYQHRIENPTGE